MAMKSWNEICQPKEQGGLGFRKFSHYNLALLSKLAWTIGSGEDSLWTRVMRGKYLKGQSFFEHNLPRGASKVWRSILTARQLIANFSCFLIGHGFNIHPWTEVPGIPNATPSLKQGGDWGTARRVAHLRGTDGWDVDLIKSLVIEEHAQGYGRYYMAF